MPIALVQQAVGTGAAGSVNFFFPSSSLPGSLLVAVISHPSSSAITLVESPNEGPLTLAISKTVAGLTVEVWFLSNILAEDTAGITVETDISDRVSVQLSEWSGLNSAAPEATNSASGLLDASPATGSVTPTSANALIIGAGGWTANDYSTGPTNSFTRLTQTGGGAAWQEAAYQIESAVAARSTGWGLTAGVNWAAVIAAFGAPAAGGAGGPSGRNLLGVGQ